jgi:hypothetical protein
VTQLCGRVAAAVVAAAAVGLAVYALGGRAQALGLGTSIVSAASVSHVHYRLDGDEPSRIDALTFSIAPALRGGRVAIRTGGATYRCRLSRGGARAVCPTRSPQLVAHELKALTVIAAQ